MPRMKAPLQRYPGIPWTSQLGGKINSQENTRDTFKYVVRTSGKPLRKDFSNSC